VKDAIGLIAQYEAWIYGGLGLVFLFYLGRVIQARVRLSATPFGLEREAAYQMQNRALAMILILAALGGAVYVGAHYILPNLDSLTTGPPPTLAPPTPTSIGGAVIVDSSGCDNANVTLINPTPNERIAGSFEARGTANIPDFAFYKLELSGANTNGEWATVEVGNEVVISDTLGTFDSSLYLPGEYAFRLMVVDAAGNSSPPCVVAVTLVSAAGP
jgi:hypothetical protein